MTSLISRLFSQGFRIFFLAAGAFAIFSMLVWELYLGVHFAGGMIYDLPFAPPPHLWHAHEMIFGYSAAALGGFLLTAVPNWTGAKAAPQRFIAVAAGVWLAGRAVMWWSGTLPASLVAIADLAFLPIMIAQIMSQLIKRPKPQNMVLVGFLGAIWVSNLVVHLEWMGVTEDSAAVGLRAGLFALCAMIAVLGGRVTPAFTRNAMKRAGVAEAFWPTSPNRIERPAILLMAALPLALLIGLPAWVLGGMAAIAGILQCLRVACWRPFWTWNQPILWSLHLGMLTLGVGLVSWGASQFALSSEVAALHVLGIGCIGGMTLAVMSRAILGHSGRPLIAPVAVAVAYGLIILAAGLRWVGSTLSGDFYFPMMLGAGGIWIIAFTLYLIALWPAISGPRQTA
ncbi:NnrS family protein [Sulfitobacter sp. JL08]|uniref:NnrS family protein n=1 Tax=Sulfitobacter sp. JL08 TaxID=2070369 RepID=UPI000E0A34B5|nr:NnrS family protein [Sulfitobacter sp. JL08]AXI56242.1 NnrS family protein [Sulfitobacter sp. JL08]